MPHFPHWMAALPGLRLALQAGLSLAAILAVWWLARWMGLGGDVRIRDADHAAELAGQTLCGFAPVAVSLDRARVGALLRDAQGRVLVLRRHGSHFVGRLLNSHSGVRLDRGSLIIATGEARFGTITLDLGSEAQVWAASLRRLETSAS
ncbi:hypothetical protein [Novosphingobium sp.]|uniref:hypothetical protein n=1 Tax=Novosphingobium sp. TaxID=1874826 RepID=UPI0025F0BC8F|nr:hypothetical protein [Novosphingobium sp.]